MKLITQIYRSKKEEGMYLYVKKEDGLSRVPSQLLQLFGTPEPAMIMLLSAEKQLAYANVQVVMARLEEVGFYLQLPPRKFLDKQTDDIRSKNTKLKQ